MDALNLKGPEFLVWYLQVFALAGVAFFILRWLLRRAPDPALRPDLDTYEIAWLKDGPRGVMRAALTALHRRGLVKVDGEWISSRATTGASVGLSAIEEVVLGALEYRRKQPAEIEHDVAAKCGEIEARMAKKGLALSPGRKAVVRWIPLLGVLACFAVGVAKVGIGVSRGRPVGLLVGLLVVSAVLLVLAAVLSRPRRTSAGDRRLEALAYRHAALRTTLNTPDGVGIEPNDAGLAVALWGTAALGTVALAPLMYTFEPRKALAASRGDGTSLGHGGSHGCGHGGGDGGGGGGAMAAVAVAVVAAAVAGAAVAVGAGADMGERETRLGLGIGWRPELALAIDRREERRRDLGFVELLAENFDPRRPLPAPLRSLRERGVRIVVHSIGLSLGGAEPVDQRRLDRLARVAEWAGASCVSDHVAFVRAGGHCSGHLLPVPRTEAALAALCANVTRAQAALPVPLALENIAALFDWPDATMDEPEFLGRLTAATGARLIVDVSNLHAAARNLGVDARAWLARVPLDRIAYAHVGGGVARGELWHDTHAHPVPGDALALLRALATQTALPGAMLERDDRFPEEAEINRELDEIAAAMRPEHGTDATDRTETESRGQETGGEWARRHRAPVPSFLPPVTGIDTAPLAAAQARLVGALVAGEPNPAGFDPARLAVESEMLRARRQRIAARARGQG